MMMNNSLAALPIDKLKRAVEIREQIDNLTKELDALIGTSSFQNGYNRRLNGTDQGWQLGAGNGLDLNGGKPRLSAEGRAKVSAAVKARWERYRAAKARMARRK